MTSALSLLYSPFPDIASARAAAAALLDAQAVACCNLLPAIESHYIWQGKLTQSAEVVLIAKTLPETAAKAAEILRQHHPYDCPAILTLDAAANAEFYTWAMTVVVPAQKP